VTHCTINEHDTRTCERLDSSVDVILFIEKSIPLANIQLTNALR
jgi:hypothetical protein